MGRFTIFILLAVSLFVACETSEEFDPTISFDGLLITEDTISFDTIVAGRKSITKRLRVINGSGNKTLLDRLFLEREEASRFRLIINGRSGYAFDEIEIASGDSLLVLVELNAPNDPSSSILPLNDLILFASPTRLNLNRTLLQAWSLSNTTYEKGTICNTTWSANQARIVKDTLVVPSGCQLTIDAGTSVLFEQGAALFIQGQLHVNASPENPALFRYVRLDPSYKTAPGQWNGIYFLEGSTNNQLNNVVIENATIGLRIGTPDEDTLADVSLGNVILRHHSGFGIQSFNSDVSAINLLVYDIGQVPLFHAIGGSYHYEHVTIANFPSQLSSQEPASIFADHLLTDTDPLIAPLTLRINNSIIWSGAADEDLVVSLLDEASSTIDVLNNIIFSTESISNNMTSSSLDYIRFMNEFGYNYKLDSMSPAIDNSANSSARMDLLGNERDSIPDLGAFEYLK